MHVHCKKYLTKDIIILDSSQPLTGILLSSPEKTKEKELIKRLRIWNGVSDFIIKKEFWEGTEPSTKYHLTVDKSTQRKIELLPYYLAALDYSATPRRLIPNDRHKHFINVHFTRKTNAKGQCRNTQTASNRRLNARMQRACRARAKCRDWTGYAPRKFGDCYHCARGGRIYTTVAGCLLIQGDQGSQVSEILECGH